MAAKSPSANHPRWPTVFDVTDLPNAAGSATQDSALELGDTCFVFSQSSLFVCTDPTLGTAVWDQIGGGGGGGGGGISVLGTDATLTTSAPGPLVVGGGEFDGSQQGTILLGLVGRYTAVGTVGSCIMRLYDWGAPGATSSPRVLRASVSIGFVDAGPAQSFTTLLTPDPAPGIGINEIFNTARVYEIEIEIVGSDGGNDVFKFLRGAIEVI